MDLQRLADELFKAASLAQWQLMRDDVFPPPWDETCVEGIRARVDALTNRTNRWTQCGLGGVRKGRPSANGRLAQLPSGCVRRP